VALPTGHVAASQSGRSSRGRRLALILVGIALLFSLLPPGPAIASTGDVVVTVKVFLNPLEVRASAPSKVTPNTIFTVRAVIRNRGDLDIEKATVVIHLPKYLDLVGSGKEIKLGTILAHKNATATWQVRAKKEGNYVILLSAAGRYGGVTVTGEDAVLVAVTPR